MSRSRPHHYRRRCPSFRTRKADTPSRPLQACPPTQPPFPTQEMDCPGMHRDSGCPQLSASAEASAITIVSRTRRADVIGRAVWVTHHPQGSLSMERAIELAQQLYRITRELTQLFPGRSFTPDGHLVGSLGEVWAQHLFDLELLPNSFETHDAKARGWCR